MNENHDPECSVDFERLREITCGDDQLFREISDQYLQQADEILKDLDRSIQSGNHEDACKLAHKLAGSSATCGMNAVVGPLRAIEALPATEFSKASDLLQELKKQMERIRQALINPS